MRRFSLSYKTGFDWVFKSEVTHVVMHILLYAGLAWLISIVFSNKKKRISPVKVVLIVFCVSILQEAIQLVSIKCLVGWDDILDILIDLSGALIGVFIFRWRQNKRNKDQLTDSQIN
jgi:VanZ family protein